MLGRVPLLPNHLTKNTEGRRSRRRRNGIYVDFGAWYDDGSSSAFTLNNADDLAGLSLLVNSGNNFSGKTITLTANLDLSAYADWETIGYRTQFAGTFDGGGKTIANLINKSKFYDSIVGLFGIIGTGGVVKNLILEDVGIYNPWYIIGGVAGVNYGTVSNCHAKGSVENGGSGNNDSTGGVVGTNNSTVENCYSTSTVTGNSEIGGVVGTVASMCTVENCYSTGSVTGISSVGGVNGIELGTVENCMALNPSITRSSGGDTNFGRVIGEREWYPSNNNYAYEDMEFYDGATLQAGFPSPDKTDTGKDGADLSGTDAKTAVANWPTPFQSAPWVWNGAAGLPSLSGVGTVQAWPF